MIEITHYNGTARNNVWYLLRHSNCLIATQDFFKISGFFSCISTGNWL